MLSAIMLNTITCATLEDFPNFISRSKSRTTEIKLKTMRKLHKFGSEVGSDSTGTVTAKTVPLKNNQLT